MTISTELTISGRPLKDHVNDLVKTYLHEMAKNGDEPVNIYDIIMTDAELPLIEATMEYTAANQSKAAEILGINRGTFRKKLERYNIS